MSPTTTSPEAVQEHVNGRLYRQSNLVQGYLATKLFPPEAVAFVRYREDFVRQRVLDLGCGGGRLAAYLRPLTARYAGLDVSSHMIEHCRRIYTELEFHQGDIRELTPIADASCAAVLAVSNLFDAVSHSDRFRVLSEVRRVLVPKGLLVFSSHNRNYRHAGKGPKLAFHRNPLTQLREFVDFVQARWSHHRYRALQRSEPEYALINDSGNNYRNLHYYISRNVQSRQLSQTGFRLLECLDPFGRSLTSADDDQDFPSIFYIARRS